MRAMRAMRRALGVVLLLLVLAITGVHGRITSEQAPQENEPELCELAAQEDSPAACEEDASNGGGSVEGAEKYEQGSGTGTESVPTADQDVEQEKQQQHTTVASQSEHGDSATELVASSTIGSAGGPVKEVAPSTAPADVSTQQLLLGLLTAELSEVEEVIRLTQQKQDVLARARQTVLESIQQQHQHQHQHQHQQQQQQQQHHHHQQQQQQQQLQQLAEGHAADAPGVGDAAEVAVAELIVTLLAQASASQPCKPLFSSPPTPELHSPRHLHNHHHHHQQQQTHPQTRPPGGAARAPATATGPAGSSSSGGGGGRYEQSQQPGRRQSSFDELVLLRATVSVPSMVVEAVVIPLAIYNPYSRSTAGSGADKAPDPELLLVVDGSGAALFFAPDGVLVANLSLAIIADAAGGNGGAAAGNSNHDNSRARATAADYTFTQSAERTLVGVLDHAGQLQLFQLNAWYDQFPLLGTKSSGGAEGRGITDLVFEDTGRRVRVFTTPNA